MAKRTNYTKEQKDHLITKINGEIMGGSSVTQACRNNGITYAQFHQWKKPHTQNPTKIRLAKKARTTHHKPSLYITDSSGNLTNLGKTNTKALDLIKTIMKQFSY